MDATFDRVISAVFIDVQTPERGRERGRSARLAGVEGRGDSWAIEPQTAPCKGRQTYPWWHKPARLLHPSLRAVRRVRATPRR